MKKTAFLLIMFLTAFPLLSQETIKKEFKVRSSEIATPESYHLEVRIEPEYGEIFVNGKFKVLLNDPSLRNISFNLHETFKIEELKINGQLADYSSKKNRPWIIIPSSKKITLKVPEGNKRKALNVGIVYHGKLEDIPEFNAAKDQKLALDDQINSRMVELASYSCWYPQFIFGVRFDIDLWLSLPDEWKSVCSGKEMESQKRKHRKLSHWSSKKDTDIVIVASPQLQLKSVEAQNFNIHIYHTQMPKDYIEREIKQIEKTVELFTKLLGKTVIPAGTVKHVFSPKRKGQGGAGYARPGMIVTSEGLTLESLKKDPDLSLFHGIAHEIAHFWWNFGSGQGDWINEAFAEYFSSVAAQRIMSEKKFRDILEKYREHVNGIPDNAPPISSVPFREGRVNYIVRYYKSSLMLDYIRNLIGDKLFFKTCRNFFNEFHKDLIGTSEFREYWGNILPEYKGTLHIWIDSPGRIPDINQN